MVRSTKPALSLALFGCLVGHAAWAAKPEPVGTCGFDRQAMQFQGPPLVQAACLLRGVHQWGRVDAASVEVPESVSRLVGRPTDSWKAPLRRWLAHLGLSEQDVGGPLDAPVSAVAREDGAAVSARYFVIHDTSWPWFGAHGFPPEADPHVNDLSRYGHASTALAHVFVNRLGRTLTTHDFSEPWRATKLEMRAVGVPVKGLFLHVELVQPRRSNPAGAAGNDAQAPLPGFTPAQYDTLALLYLAASVRAGEGLIPALHGAVDEGLIDGHDDPQNFLLTAFAAALARLEQQLSALFVP